MIRIPSFGAAAALAMFGAGAALGCSSSSSSAESPSDSDAALLDGAYLSKSTAGGRLLGIVFSEGRYRLRHVGCDDVGCEEVGRFSYDRRRAAVDLVVDGDGRTYAMSLEVVSTRPAGVTPRSASLAPSSQQLLEGSSTLVVASQVLIEGESFQNEPGLCDGQKIFNATATYKTMTYFGNDRDRRNVGEVACSRARDDVNAACKRSPWVCTATPSGTTALPPDCEGVLEISCTCTATTKCNYSW
ncbi:MAG: hypothetical protein JST00_04055 [Deltaproteobacteria bacterium]|nr:hypothetical protein [Deltaproteobacteria bacterium]